MMRHCVRASPHAKEKASVLANLQVCFVESPALVVREESLVRLRYVPFSKTCS